MYREEVSHVNIQVFQDQPNIILTCCEPSALSCLRSILRGHTIRLALKFTQTIAGNNQLCLVSEISHARLLSKIKTTLIRGFSSDCQTVQNVVLLCVKFVEACCSPASPSDVNTSHSSRLASPGETQRGDDVLHCNFETSDQLRLDVKLQFCMVSVASNLWTALLYHNYSISSSQLCTY